MATVGFGLREFAFGSKICAEKQTLLCENKLSEYGVKARFGP